MQVGETAIKPVGSNLNCTQQLKLRITSTAKYRNLSRAQLSNAKCHYVTSDTLKGLKFVGFLHKGTETPTLTRRPQDHPNALGPGEGSRRRVLLGAPRVGTFHGDLRDPVQLHSAASAEGRDLTPTVHTLCFNSPALKSLLLNFC